MQFNNLGINFKYLIVNGKDKTFGLTVNTVGFQPIAENTLYPSIKHPKAYYFDPLKGRTLCEYQFIYISKGKGVFESESTKKTSIRKGQVIVLFPGQWHSYHPLQSTGWNEYYIGFEGPFADQLSENEFISKKTQILDVGFNEDLVNLFITAIKVANEDKIASQQFLAGIALHILGMILSLSQNKNFEINDTGQLIERAKIIMNENISREIDFDQLARKLGTSYSWFRKVFKEYTGYPPAKYFHEIKLRKAKELLAETNLSIKEIAYRLNYSSYEYFLSLFKKRVGVTPLDYRDAGNNHSYARKNKTNIMQE
ncbi:MAG TPA: AraC family transcriptional regulator [Porphyromonadaceae bacterium]|nr:AraC family transcriptional regulator [Porphyromonadaceae bacterium]